MTYAISDLHGRYDLYLEMLDKISFSENDTLYVLGDCIDRGEDGLKILFHMMKHKNIIPICGNHEFMAFDVLAHIFKNRLTKENFMESVLKKYKILYKDWMRNGGESTLEDFLELDDGEREKLLEYFCEFTAYEEISVNGNDFVLVHGGFPFYSPDMDLEYYDLYDVVWERTDYFRRYFADKYLVTGHTPTMFIDAENTGEIYRGFGHIAIDCGAVYGYGLGCIRLDDFEEFYV